MLTNRYLLFTDNFLLARLEVLLLGGSVLKKISEQIFFISIPANIDIKNLQYSNTEVPQQICNNALCMLTERIKTQCITNTNSYFAND